MGIYSTPAYDIKVGVSREDPESPAYHVINRDSGVIEYEDYMLARTIDTMLQMQERLDEVLVKFNTPVAPKFTVVEPNKLN